MLAERHAHTRTRGAMRARGARGEAAEGNPTSSYHDLRFHALLVTAPANQTLSVLAGLCDTSSTYNVEKAVATRQPRCAARQPACLRVTRRSSTSSRPQRPKAPKHCGENHLADEETTLARALRRQETLRDLQRVANRTWSHPAHPDFIPTLPEHRSV